MRDLSEGQETWYIRLLHLTHHRGRVDHLGWRLGGEKLEHVTNCALHATERITCSCGKDRTTTMAHASSGFDLLKEMSTPPTSFSPANLSPSRQESTSSESSSDSICFRDSCSLRAHILQAVPSAGAHTHTVTLSSACLHVAIPTGRQGTMSTHTIHWSFFSRSFWSFWSSSPAS